jgi:hypothetical protein
MDDDERMEPVTFDVDTLDALGKILRAGARLTCNAEGFCLLDGPDDYSGAGGPTIAAAVAGYTETVLHGRVLRRAQQEGLD